MMGGRVVILTIAILFVAVNALYVPGELIDYRVGDPPVRVLIFSFHPHMI